MIIQFYFQCTQIMMNSISTSDGLRQHQQTGMQIPNPTANVQTDAIQMKKTNLDFSTSCLLCIVLWWNIPSKKKKKGELKLELSTIGINFLGQFVTFHLSSKCVKNVANFLEASENRFFCPNFSNRPIIIVCIGVSTPP